MTGAPILGADPGMSGALAYLYDDGTINAEDVPVVDGAVDVDAIVRLVRARSPRPAIIEKAQSMPRQGVSSTFKYGVAFGALCAVVAVCEVPMHLVSPRRWKSFFGLDSDKERSRAMAIRLWPGTGLFERKRDERRAGAALLARYGADVIERARP